MICNHLLVEGFGMYGDAFVCLHCGWSRYPEVAPIAVALAKAQGRYIENPTQEQFRQAEQARQHREAMSGGI